VELDVTFRENLTKNLIKVLYLIGQPITPVVVVGANQIKLPLTSTGIYSFIVDWGDGSSNKITVGIKQKQHILTSRYL
jgi:hypothetical protein